MNPWLLILTSLGVLYLLLMGIKLVFSEIDAYHAANPRNNGGKRVGRSEG